MVSKGVGESEDGRFESIIGHVRRSTFVKEIVSVVRCLPKIRECL